MSEHYGQGRNHVENLFATSAMVDRVRVSENLGVTAVIPVAPLDTSPKSMIVVKVG